MITVIITVHPPLLPYLKRCVDSVEWQLSGDELIIVADGCTKQQVEVIIGKDRATIYTFEYTMGVSKARNLGIHHARGHWIKLLDADDLLAPFALAAFRAIQASVESDDKIAVVAGQQVKVVNGLPRGVTTPLSGEALLDAMTKANPLLVSMVFVRRSLLFNGSPVPFDERIEFEEDWDFWLALRARGYQFATCKVPFCYYWIDDKERSEKKRNHQVNGMDVRAYLAKTYGITPV